VRRADPATLAVRVHPTLATTCATGFSMCGPTSLQSVVVPHSVLVLRLKRSCRAASVDASSPHSRGTATAQDGKFQRPSHPRGQLLKIPMHSHQLDFRELQVVQPAVDVPVLAAIRSPSCSPWCSEARPAGQQDSNLERLGATAL
jgi:hypothetical protein